MGKNEIFSINTASISGYFAFPCSDVPPGDPLALKGLAFQSCILE